MKNLDNEMNILRNADDEVLERMSKKYNAVDKRSLNRMFEMSERKYEAMKTNSIEFSENTVTGVERYKRPKWYRPAYAVSACLVAVIGIAGSALIIKNLSSTGDGKITKPPVISSPSEEVSATTTGTSVSGIYSQTTPANAYVVSVDGTVVSTGETSTAIVTSVPKSTSQTEVNNNSNSSTGETPSPAKPVIEDNVINNPEHTEPATTAPQNTEPSDLVKNFSIEGYWKVNGDNPSNSDLCMIWSINNGSGGNIDTKQGIGSPFAYEITGYSNDGIDVMFHFFTAYDESPAKIVPLSNDSFTINYTDYPDEPITLTRISQDEYNRLNYVGTYNGMSATFLNYVTTIENWNLGNVSFYENDFTYYNGEKYFRVVDTELTVDYIRSYLKNSISDSLYNRRYSGIIDSDTPRFIEQDGITYVLPRFTSGNFSWVDMDNMTTENATKNSGTIVAKYDNFGVIDTLRINVILSPDSNTYKIDSMSSSDGTNY